MIKSDRKEQPVFVLIQMDIKGDMNRLKTDVPAILEILKDCSNNNMEQVCRSADGKLFGYFIKTKLLPVMIRSRLRLSESTRNEDSFLVFDVGSEFDGTGFSRAWTWLQHRPAA